MSPPPITMNPGTRMGATVRALARGPFGHGLEILLQQEAEGRVALAARVTALDEVPEHAPALDYVAFDEVGLARPRPGIGPVVEVGPRPGHAPSLVVLL